MNGSLTEMHLFCHLTISKAVKTTSTENQSNLLWQLLYRMIDTPQPILLLLIRVMFIPFHFKVNQVLVDLLQPRLTSDAINT